MSGSRPYRADRTQAAADANPGRMAALLGATLEQAEAGCAAAADACWIANDNADGQVVLAGTPAGLEAGVAAAKAAGARTSRSLAVGGAFHTPLMQPAVDALRGDLATVTFLAPGAPVVSNADGLAYDATASADDWRERSATHVATHGQVAVGAADARRTGRDPRSSRSATAPCWRRSRSERFPAYRS